MNTDKSLYGIILQNLTDGRLPKDFSLPAEEDEEEIHFADGAMDGISVYHMGRSRMDASGTRLMIKALKYAAAGNAEKADETFAELGKTFRAIGIIDDLQKYIMKNTEKLSAENVYHSAMYLIGHSHNRESVKFGLSILELLQVPKEPIKEIMRRLGLSDEFTIFAVWNMQKWDNGNEEIFRLIQKVNGWGRIHALERLEPETSEIRRWMLFEGVNNYVMPAYSALTVWQKADVQDFLNGKLSKEEFSAIGQIIAALLDEGPVAGISKIENAQEMLLDYLDRAGEFDLDINDYETIYEISLWAPAEDVDAFAITEECAEILSSEACTDTVTEAVKEGKGVLLADALGIEYEEEPEDE